MLHEFEPGDFLIFQLESGYALLRVLEVDTSEADGVWHLTAYRDLFLDPEAVDRALQSPGDLTVDRPHIAITNRGFESTQVAKMSNLPLLPEELEALEIWKRDSGQEVLDRSVRLILGLR